MILVFSIAAAITGSLALCLLFFQATRKTYPGFGHWTAGVAIIAVGYLLFGLRGITPLWVSVFLGNLAIPLGLLCQLDGIKLFLGLSTSRWPYLVVSALLASALAIFSFHWDSVYWRGVSTSLPMIAVQWYMAALLFRGSAFPRSLFLKAIGSLLVLGGLLVLSRIVWFAFPSSSSQVWTSQSEAFFFIAFVAVHLGESFSMIMLNAERLESELLGAQKDLSHSVNSLQEALTLQKQAEESLRDSEERYRTFFDTSRDAVFITTLDGRFIDFNEEALELLGYAKSQRHEVLGRAVSEFYAHPEERQAHSAKVAELGFSKEYPVDLRRQDGTIIHTLITTVARKDSEGNIVGFQGTVRDITDRKKHEEALRASEKRLRDVIDSTPFPVALVDTADDKIFMWSQSATELFGHTAPTAQEWYQIAYPDPDYRKDVLKRWKPLLAIARSSGQTVNTGEYQVTCKDGSVRACELYARFITDYLLVTFNDITERKVAEKDLRESQERLTYVLEGSRDGFWDWNVRTGEVHRNERWAQMLGYSFKEIAFTVPQWADLVHPEDKDRAWKSIQDHLEGRTSEHACEYRMLAKDGSCKWILDRALVVERDEGGKPIRMAGTHTDISDRKKAEEERDRFKNQLFQGQKMEAIGTLTGGIAHDFNNLLTVVNGYTEMVLLETAEDDHRYEDLQKILQTGRKGAELVQRLLAFSKKGESNPQSLDLTRAVENVVALLKRTMPKMIEVETVLDKDLSAVKADEGQIEQVLMNLCVNAWEAMPNGGKLRIETKNVTVDETYCSFHAVAKPGLHVLIEVADTGLGMDAETLARIFDPFFTTKGWDFNRGTGLGLSVAKGIIEQHGGRINCESELGKGTTFSIYFPAVGESVEAVEPRPKKSDLQAEGSILLVDDEDLVRELGKRILERAGYRVITASNGKEALDIYSRKQESTSLVVLDLIMPKMSGEKCLEGLFKINPQVKVIVSSGHSLDLREQNRLGALAKGFVNKPYQVEHLLRAVQGALTEE